MKRRPIFRLAASALLALLTACGSGAPRMDLHTAANNGQITIVKKHAAAGTDLNAKNSDGKTALHLAAQKGNLAIVQALVEGGADINLTDANGQTASQIARRAGHVQIVQALIPAPEKPQRGRGLIDGGLGVSGAMDAF